MDESMLPIDIHASKLLDWLVSRRHVDKDWMKSLTQIRQMIVKALEDMPENESIARLLSSGQQLNYYTCKDIVEVLRQTEADTKNFFGYYSSQRMKDWQEILKMYEKDGIHLAEIAQMIVRNVTYEIPSLRKQVAKADSMIEGLRKKQSDCSKRSKLLQAEYVNFAAELGITGVDVKKELTEQLSLFPTLISEISDKLVSLKKVLDFYTQFVSATSNDAPTLCPLIDYVTRKGNTTYFEFVNGEKPDLIVEEQNDCLTKGSESPTNEAAGIDFGDVAIDYTDSIDFGDNENGSGSAGTGTSGSNGDSFVHVHDSDVAGSKRSSVDEINWDVDVNASQVTESSSESRVARGVYALTLIEFRETRDSLISEINELECFLEQRIFEMSQGDQDFINLLMGSQLTSFTTDVESLVEMLHEVRQVLALMSSDRINMLYMIRENPKFSETISRKLQLKTELSSKALDQAESLRIKEQEVMREKMNIIEQIPLLIQATVELESRLSSDISIRYKHRPVNIMAGAQVL